MFELALATAADCLKAIDAPIIIGDHVFPAFPAYSSENVLHKINLTSVMCETEKILKSRLFSTFKRFGPVKDIVIYHDDINCEWFTGKGHIYLEIPKDSTDIFEILTHRISLAGTDSSLLATWDRMPDYCRYFKAMGHTKDSRDKRPANPPYLLHLS